MRLQAYWDDVNLIQIQDVEHVYRLCLLEFSDHQWIDQNVIPNMIEMEYLGQKFSMRNMVYAQIDKKNDVGK